MEQWKERAYDTIPLLQLGIRDSVPPRLRNAIAQDLVRAVDDVSRSQQDMVKSVPNIALDVVAPAVLSLVGGGCGGPGPAGGQVVVFVLVKIQTERRGERRAGLDEGGPIVVGNLVDL